MTAARVTAAEMAELRAQFAAMAGDAERIAAAFASIGGVITVAKAAWDDGFEKGQEMPRPAVPAQPARGRRGLHAVASAPRAEVRKH